MQDTPGGSRVPARRRRLYPGPRASAYARCSVREALNDWGLPDLADTATLLASELVTNAIRHASRGQVLRPIIFHVMRVSDGVIIQVDDSNPKTPRLIANPSARSEGHRGLLLVNKLSAEWGCKPRPRGAQGNRVWFRIAA